MRLFQITGKCQGAPHVIAPIDPFFINHREQAGSLKNVESFLRTARFNQQCPIIDIIACFGRIFIDGLKKEFFRFSINISSA